MRAVFHGHHVGRQASAAGRLFTHNSSAVAVYRAYGFRVAVLRTEK